MSAASTSVAPTRRRRTAMVAVAGCPRTPVTAMARQAEGNPMPYTMQGIYLEACDCHAMCPCWIDGDPHGDQCTGLIAWHVEKGTIDGVDVSNLSVVSFSH